MNDSKNIIDVVILAGEILLHNGAEIFRVQETMIKMAEAYKVTSFDVYVISNGIFVSLSENGKNYSTGIKHVPLSPVHLGRVAAVNDLSRKIAEGTCTLQEAYDRLKEIEKIPYKPKWFQILCSGIGSGCFSYLLGGTVYDSITAFLAGVILYVFIIGVSDKKISKILVNILGSGLATLCGLVFFNLGMGDQFHKIIIGSIIPLVPGVPLTSSVRDFLNSDYLSGTIRLIDAVLIAFCIAIGVGGMLKIWSSLFAGGMMG